MRKYLIRYLIFWLPAFLVATFFNNSSLISHILQWFFAFFLLFSWAVNTGMAAYRLPRATVAVLLTYTGFHILAITFMYFAESGTGLRTVLRAVGGFFSFQPMGILLRSLQPVTAVPLPWEYILLGVLVGFCAAGYLVGVIQRRVSPDPYSPRIKREG